MFARAEAGPNLVEIGPDPPEIAKLRPRCGHNVDDIVVRSDSTAAWGIASRRGAGRRATHLHVSSLYTQHMAKERRF